MARVTNKPRSFAQIVWAQSAEFRQIGLSALRAVHAGPKCGATTKSSGQPCRKPALKNGRCRHHGGLTKSGRDWHRPQLPSGPKALERLERKLADLARRRAAQAERLAAMSPDELARYEEWQRAHKPGPRSERERGRRDREARRVLDRLLQDDEPEGRAAADDLGVFG